MKEPCYSYVACDLGAESGRVMVGTLFEGRLTLEEIHRFSNGAIRINGSLRWDLLRIFEELKNGLMKVAQRKIPISSISTDSWGVDYVLMRLPEPFLSAPYQYRDARTDGGLERAFATVPADEIFAETGLQFMTINTLYQLLEDKTHRSALLEISQQFLLIGDYFNYLWSGVPKAEQSLASTTQLYNPITKSWSESLISRFELPRPLFPEIIPSGSVLGALLPEIAHETGLSSEVKVVASCSHDTGAAIAAVPAEGSHWAYLSSGTWSLLGVELSESLISPQSRHYNFTNEAGYGGTTRFLKNIVGLWIVQECRRSWAQEGKEYGYDQLTEMAESAPSLRRLIHPNASRFGKPDQMPQKIHAYCQETQQQPPEHPGEMVRATLESLALLYRQTIEEIEKVTGKNIQILHIVGGGTRNRLLNQFAANATGRTVKAGPVEATAAGNVLIQALSLGHLNSLDHLRRVVHSSFPMEIYKPQAVEEWNAAYTRFKSLPI